MPNKLNRYQIILESEKVLSDDDFEQIVKDDLCIHTGSGIFKPITRSDFKLVSAINLEGIRRSFDEGVSKSFEFYCEKHDIGWNTSEEGQRSGCPRCNWLEGLSE